MKPKSYGLLASFCMLCLVLSAIHPGQAATAPGVMVSDGDYLQYSGSASAAYIMYGTGIYITITDNSTYPVNGTLQYMLSGGPSSSNPVTSGKNLTLFVVTVPSTWQAGPENSPFQGVVDPNSPFIVNWTTPNLIFYDPNNNVFANLVRNVTTLTFPYNYDINVSGRIQPVNSTCQYRWDMATGVLLSYYINITNTADSSLDGYFSMSLSATNVWSLPTASVSAFPLEWIMISSMLITIPIYFSVKKHTHNKTMLMGGI